MGVGERRWRVRSDGRYFLSVGVPLVLRRRRPLRDPEEFSTQELVLFRQFLSEPEPKKKKKHKSLSCSEHTRRDIGAARRVGFHSRGLHYVVAERLRPVAHRFSSVRVGLCVRQGHLPKHQPVHEPFEAVFNNASRRGLRFPVAVLVARRLQLSPASLSCVRRLHRNGSHRDTGALARQ